MPNFRSLAQSLHIDNFCKNREVGGGGGGPLLSFSTKKPKPFLTGDIPKGLPSGVS